jgi:hypothetical protein
LVAEYAAAPGGAPSEEAGRFRPPLMSVLFHLASQADWKRALGTGSYTTASVRGDGVVPCASAAQHAAVANARFAGRTDLVLLLLQPPFHQIWARRGPGQPSTADDLAADPTTLGFLLEQGSTDRWVFRRYPAVTRPLRQLGRATADGVPYVAPEVALLFKAKAPRFKDQRDFDRVLPVLDGAARAFLAWALEQAQPGHPWRAQL